MSDNVPNYTDAMVTQMTDLYTSVPTLDTAKKIADDFGKSPKSVIAKLVSLGIYQKAERTTKTGAKPVQKAQLVKLIEAHYGFEMKSLVKATKIDLQNLVDNLD